MIFRRKENKNVIRSIETTKTPQKNILKNPNEKINLQKSLISLLTNTFTGPNIRRKRT